MMESSRNERWIIPFKKFGRLTVKLTMDCFKFKPEAAGKGSG